MLRSRGNRQQRPSESTDERASSSSSYRGYNNNPSSSPMSMGIASGADDYDPYGKPLAQKKQSNVSMRGRFGFGTSSSGGAIKKAPGSSSSYGASTNSYGAPTNVWDRKSIGSTIKGPSSSNKNNSSSSSSAITMIFMIALLTTISLGGMTLHYKRAISRMEHELTIVKRRGNRGRHNLNNRFNREDEDGEEELNRENFEDELDQGEDDETEDEQDNEEPPADIKEIAQLSQTLKDLNIESKKWTTRSGTLNSDIQAIESQIKHLQNSAIPNYEKQIEGMKKTLDLEQTKGKEYKMQFVNAHIQSASMIVPGGPGHSRNQEKALNQMESLEDYEQYVEERENALWDKIDVLVAKLERESRREAVEWYVMY